MICGLVRKCLTVHKIWSATQISTTSRARELTHEANNMLTAIRLYASTIEAGNADAVKTQAMAAYIVATTGDVAAVVEQLRALLSPKRRIVF